MLVEVKIGAIIMDPNTNSPIVVLKGVNSETILPIWVGAYEANAIALEIEKIASQRPLTHDLLKNLILQTGYKMNRVIISDLQNNTFYALIELIDENGTKLTLDSRPSDAIALALRLDSTIFVKQKVFDISSVPVESETAAADESNLPADEWPELIS